MDNLSGGHHWSGEALQALGQPLCSHLCDREGSSSYYQPAFLPPLDPPLIFLCLLHPDCHVEGPRWSSGRGLKSLAAACYASL